MSRRRKPQKASLPPRPPPNDGTPLGHLSDAELVKEFARELARRRAAGGKLDLDTIESFATDVQRDMGGETLVVVIRGASARDDDAQAVPEVWRADAGEGAQPGAKRPDGGR